MLESLNDNGSNLILDGSTNWFANQTVYQLNVSTQKLIKEQRRTYSHIILDVS